MCISLEKNTWKIIFGHEKVRENCRGPSAATLLEFQNNLEKFDDNPPFRYF